MRLEAQSIRPEPCPDAEPTITVHDSSNNGKKAVEDESYTPMPSAAPKECQAKRPSGEQTNFMPKRQAQTKVERRIVKQMHRGMPNKPIKKTSARYSTIQPNGSSRPHVLKTSSQIAQLAIEWQKSQAFSQERIRSIAQRVGLPNRKVYKWVWDRKKEAALAQP